MLNRLNKTHQPLVVYTQQTLTSQVDHEKSMPSHQLLGDQAFHTLSLPLFQIV